VATRTREATRLGARSPAVVPAFITGMGLGAFIDGIILHQVLQWHHLVSAYTPDDDLAGLERNTFWDGVFHVAAWWLVLGGLLWLWRRRAATPGLPLGGLVGTMLIGWGVFNVVDQLVFHMALGAHHIRMVENYQVYDWSFTALGVALAALGWLLLRRTQPR
jgi:uncharacterized membrane protein